MSAEPTTGRARDPLLRRVDWRVLIPSDGTPRDHVVVLGGPEGVARALASTADALAVTTAMPGDPVDGLALLAGGRSHPPGADRVRGGGFIYWEVDRRSRSGWRWTPARCSRELAGRGWTVVSQHWAKPGFASPNGFIPMARGPLQWYVDTQCSARSPLRRALLPVLRTLVRRPGLLAALVPTHCTIAVRGGPSVPADGAWPAPVVATVPADELAPLDHRAALLCGGEGDWARLVLVMFDKGGAARAIVKVARTPASNESIEAEQRTLASMGEGAARRAPRPRGTGEWHSVRTAREDAMAGSSVALSTGRWPRSVRRSARDLREVAAWLTGWHLRDRVDAAWDGEATRRWWGGVADRYEAVFGATAAERQLFTAVAATAGALSGRTFPVVTNHRDLGPWNVLRTPSGVRALDWEVARPGPVLADLVYLSLHWEAIARGRPFEAVAAEAAASLAPGGDTAGGRSWGQVTRLRRVRDEVWREYLAAISLDVDFVPLVIARTLAEQALDRRDRLAAAGRPGSDDRAGNVYCEALDAFARAGGGTCRRG